MENLEELQLKDEKFIQPPELGSHFRLYGHHACPYVERVKMAFALKHIPYQFVSIDLPSRPAWYNSLPSGGRIPTLELPKRAGFLHESLVLAQLVDELEDGPVQLLPRGPENVVLRARIRLLLGQLDGISKNYYASVKSFGEDEDGVEKLHEDYKKLDKLLAENDNGKKNPFFFDQEKPTIGDLALFPNIRRFMLCEGFELTDELFKNLGLKEFAHLMKWYEALMGIKEVKENTVDAETYRRFLQRYKLTGKFTFTLP